MEDYVREYVNKHPHIKAQCPHCREDTMDYIILTEPIEGATRDVTHAYVCSQCPNVMIEYSFAEDVIRLKNYLNREENKLEWS